MLEMMIYEDNDCSDGDNCIDDVKVDDDWGWL